MPSSYSKTQPLYVQLVQMAAIQSTISVTDSVVCKTFNCNEVLIAPNFYRVWFRHSSVSSNHDFKYCCRINLLMPTGTLYRGMRRICFQVAVPRLYELQVNTLNIWLFLDRTAQSINAAVC